VNLSDSEIGWPLDELLAMVGVIYARTVPDWILTLQRTARHVYPITAGVSPQSQPTRSETRCEQLGEG